MSKNQFGGRKGSLYTPMSEIEQEALMRMTERQDLEVRIKGWACIQNPKVVVGDLRLGISFRLHFEEGKAPIAPTPVYYFDLELWSAGKCLFKERQTAVYAGNALSVAAGMYLDMVWDIAITALDPKFVKMLMPHTIGLTSRFQDKDTGDFTLFGNNKFNDQLKPDLIKLRKGEASVRKDTAQQTKKAEKKSSTDKSHPKLILK